MLRLVDEHVNLAPERVTLVSIPEKAAERRAMTSNRWKERGPTLETIRLREAIATELMRSDAFVVFHTDADRVWAKRGKSENREKFQTIIVDGVKAVLGSPRLSRSPLDRRPPPQRLTDEEIEVALSKLFLASPCYSIEAWLYQATDVVASRCRARHGSEMHQARIQSWAADRTALDEVARPKDEALPCVADHANAELAAALPARAVYEAGRSFTEAVDAMAWCAPLLDALRRTYEVASL